MRRIKFLKDLPVLLRATQEIATDNIGHIKSVRPKIEIPELWLEHCKTTNDLLEPMINWKLSEFLQTYQKDLSDKDMKNFEYFDPKIDNLFDVVVTPINDSDKVVLQKIHGNLMSEIVRNTLNQIFDGELDHFWHPSFSDKI